MRLVVLAAEASGDALGARLLGRLAVEDAVGTGGPRLLAAGLRPLLATGRPGIVGLPGLRMALGFARRIHRLRQAIRAYRPDAVVSIDSPTLHLRVVRGLPFPKLHWVSPQVWAWRPGRVHRIARSVDALACLLPFEPALYAGTGLTVRFTGHPLADRPVARLGSATAVLAGSRADERRRLGPLFAAATEGMTRIEVVPPGARPCIEPHVHGLSALDGRVRRALACSGTVTLELALQGIPQLAAYATDPLTLAVGRRLVRVPDLVLPNLVLGRRVVPAIVQPDGPAALRRGLDALDPDAQRNSVDELRYLLRPHGAVDRVACLLDSIRGRP
jgi:lipid-A-disaccharide synthase